MLSLHRLRHLALAAGAVLSVGVGAWACGGATDPGDAPVAQVALSDTTVDLRLGDEAVLVARAVRADGEELAGRRVFWSTRDTAVAVVTQAGVIRALAVGTTQVAANVEGRAAVAQVIVRARPVATVQVEPTTVQIVVGARRRITARALNDAGLPVAAAVTWRTEAPTVVSVSADGEVAGLVPGVGVVSATADGVTATAAVVVSPVPVARVTVAPATAALVVGATQQLTATPADANGARLADRAVAWTSRDPGVASVSSTGQVTGVAPGTATVVATVEGQSAAATVTVRPVPVAAVRLTPDNAAVGVGGTLRLGAVVADAAGNALAGRAVTFTSNAPGVARVAADGTVTGVAPGTATITGISEGVSGSAAVRVTAPTATSTVATVDVAPASVTLTAGQTRALTATPRASDGGAVAGRTITWSSSAPTVVTVSSSGVVTAVGSGTAQVLARVDGITGSASVMVQPVPVASVQVTPAAARVPAGESVQLTAAPRDGSGAALSGRAVTWASSNQAVATVGSDGRVVGVAPGEATVRATSEGVTGSAAVTVTPVVRVSPDAVQLRDRGGSRRTAQLVATDHTGRVLAPGEVTWTSENPQVATVDATGLVRGVSSGSGTASTTVTATYRGVRASVAVTVSRN